MREFGPCLGAVLPGARGCGVVGSAAAGDRRGWEKRVRHPAPGGQAAAEVVAWRCLKVLARLPSLPDFYSVSTLPELAGTAIAGTAGNGRPNRRAGRGPEQKISEDPAVRAGFTCRAAAGARWALRV